MSRRVVLGKQNDGTYGLRVSLAGKDALTGDSSTGDFSFDSSWTDITQIHQVGIATQTASGRSPMDIIYPDLGYVAFAEVRWLNGLTIYDDYYVTGSTAIFGIAAQIRSTNDRLTVVLDPSQSVVYVVYKQACPSG